MSDRNTVSGLEELRRLETEATSGHWYVETMGNHRSDVLATHEDGALVICEHAGIDAEFIVAARNQLPRILDALDAVLALADHWESRGEHDMRFSKTIADEDIAMAILTDGATKVENARHIRAAITKALEAEQ